MFGFAVLIAVGVGGLAALVLGSANSRVWRKVVPWMRGHRRLSLLGAAGVAALSLFAGMWIQSRLGLPNAVACLKNKGTALDGAFVGQTGDRTYVGEPKTTTTEKRIVSIPNDEVGVLFIGGAIPDDQGGELCKTYESTGSAGSSSGQGK